MAAVDETITGTATSTVFTPSNGVSDVVNEAVQGDGEVVLECKSPTSTAWKLVSRETGAFNVLTPDTAVTYRFRARNVTGTPRVYMGP